MKIELELPDWVEGKHLYITAGIELVAYKYLNTPWMMKTGRCDMCGKCCMNFGEVTGDLREMVDETGNCKYLISDGDKWVCLLGSSRPWSCSVVATPKNVPECTETFKEV
jgi:hypothetical protein